MSLSDPDPLIIGGDDARGDISGLERGGSGVADHGDPQADRGRWCCRHPDCALVEGAGSGLGGYQRAIDHFFDQHPMITTAQRRMVEGP